MTLSDRLKSEAALDSTFSKAQRLVADGDVLSCEATPSQIDGVVRLSGLVQGSGVGSYRTSVTLDLNDEDVVTYQCTCPAAVNYDGMCKHEIALALAYLGGRAPAGTPSVGSPNSAGLSPASSKVPAAPTSSQITDLLSAITAERVGAAAAAQRARAAVRQPLEEPVELLVTLSPAPTAIYQRGSQALALKLRVRSGKATYVVKNVATLVQTWEEGAEFSYGKNLSFAHVPEAFTPRARRLLAVVARVVHSQQALFMSRYNYWSAGRGTDIKELPLSEADAIEVLDVLEGTEFTLDFSGYYPPQPPRTLAVTAADPRVPAVLTPARDGGLDLALPTHLRCFAAEKRLYLLGEQEAWRCAEKFSAQSATLFSSLLPCTRPLHIGPGDLASFCRTALPVLRSCTDLDAPDNLDALLPPAPELAFKVGLDDGLVTCRATVRYGERELDLFAPERPGQPARDPVLEYEAQDIVEAYFPSLPAASAAPAPAPAGAPAHGASPQARELPHFDESDDELLYLLLTEGLRELSRLGEVLLSERLRAVRVRESPQVRVKATVYGGLLDLAVDASGMTARDLTAYLESYRRKQRYLRLSDGDILKLDGSVRALDNLADGLNVSAEELAGGVSGLPSSRTLFVDALLKKADGVRLEGDGGFRAIVRDLETFGDADFEVPASLREVLRPYQVEGFRWLETLERLGFGGILADDMGLGKTLQTIAHIVARREAGDTGTTLVVAPASLVYNWVAELERFAPQLKVAAVTGTKAARRMAIAGAAERDVLATSYDLMKRDVAEYAEVRFSRVILDEAQYIKNPGTQVAKAAKCPVAPVRLALTGTPVENRSAELWSIFDFLMPGILGSRKDFAERFEGPVEAREEGAADQLRRLVAPFILRRLKRDVLTDLPEKSESVVFAQMEGEQAKLYKASQDRLALQITHELPDDLKRNKLQVLAELTKLRQVCCDPRLYYEGYAGGSAKLETCMELVGNALEGGHRVLIFSQFASMLELLGERLREAGVGHLVLTGSTSKEERARLVARFQGGEVPVFLISLKAGGTGLNLTAADVVIHYDPWWNLAAQDQATDRAHRIGQEREVSVFKLIAKDTVEERIMQMQERKRDLADSILGGEDVASTALNREDILALLGA